MTLKGKGRYIAAVVAVAVLAFLFVFFTACAPTDIPDEPAESETVGPAEDEQQKEPQPGGDGKDDERPDGDNGKDKDKDGDKNKDKDKEEQKQKTALEYVFSGGNAGAAGYAEGTISLTAAESGEYELYWADGSGALDGFYPICTLTVAAGAKETHTVGYHVAIPADATRIVAIKGETVAAEYAIPEGKRLGAKLYSFNSYSDVHIDVDGYYKNAEKNWAQALAFAKAKGADFIVSSGDMVTNAHGPAEEWRVYQNVLASSEFTGEVWESDGNHDMRCGVEGGIYSFIRATGCDGTLANYNSGKPYYSVTERSTGDLFIFMALEAGSDPSKCDEFSAAQLAWVKKLVADNYGTGINIYIIEHSPINGFGAGDRMSDPHYKAHLSESYASTVEFKSLLIDYPGLIWMSGHTHEDFSLGYNYSDEGGTACHMIHNPSVAGTTKANSSGGLDYNNGVGFGSQGYYVEVRADGVVYYGADLNAGKIYPEYCYVMAGARGAGSAGKAAGEPAGSARLSAEQALAAEDALEKRTAFSSYDCYVALKRAVLGGGASAAELEEMISALEAVADGIERKYIYVENTRDWSGDIYCYAWRGSDINASWPGVKLQKTGTNSGHDVYGAQFDYAGQYTHVIFNNGSGSGKPQTANIDLSEYRTNSFYVKETTDGKGRNNVGSFEFSRFAVRYYNGSAHDWDRIDTFMRQNNDGTYSLELPAVNSSDINLNVYDNGVSGGFYCVSGSENFIFAAGESHTYTLTGPTSSRGKSITVKGLAAGNRLRLVYTPATKSLVITCA